MQIEKLDTRALKERLRPFIVQLLRIDDPSSRTPRIGRHGTGFMVSNQPYVLTCYHNYRQYLECRDEGNLYALVHESVTPDRPTFLKFYSAIQLKYIAGDYEEDEKHSGQDTVLFRLVGTESIPLPETLRFEPLSEIQMNEPVVFMGFPHSGRAKESTRRGRQPLLEARIGKIEKVAKDPFGYYYIRVDQSSETGFSGSPLVNLRTGNITGILKGQLKEIAGKKAHARPTEAGKQLLEQQQGQ